MQRFKRAFLFGMVAFPLRAELAYTPLTTEQVGTIDFKGDCGEERWSTAPDGTVSLEMSGSDGGECTATILFETPLRLGEKPGLTFEVKGSLEKQLYAIEIPLSESGGRWRRTKPYPAPSAWHKDGLDFFRWKPTQGLLKLAGIRFVAMSNRPRTAPILSIRGLRLSDRRALAPVQTENPAPAAPVATSSSQEPMVVQMEEPSLPDFEEKPLLSAIKEVDRTSWRRGLLHGLRALMILTATASGIWLVLLLARGIRRFRLRGMLRRLKAPAFVPSSLSPLFEMNTRTWKSYRDGEGVIHVGGFTNITEQDLIALKTKGFEAVWFMGIWEVGPKVRHVSRRYAPDYKGSPYAISDYRVSAELGSEDDFTALVARARKVGLRVVVDFVPNHMGMDCAWLNTNPEYFIHKAVPAEDISLSDAELEQRHPGYFVYHTPLYPQNGRRMPKTILVAHGKDPYFYPWIDTAQLDYARADVRQKMTEVLCGMATHVDGVRCDMAMLVLKEEVRNHRHPEMSEEQFQAAMPQEFWTEAIAAAKKVNPRFSFVAETYWGLEGYLQQVGFDFTYNKPLYEAVCSAFHSGHAEGLMNFLRILGTAFLKRSVHFLENHDEERAMNALGYDRQRAAAALMATLPGTVLIHQGQMEGVRERLPVQRVLPLEPQAPDAGLLDFYGKLLQTIRRPVFARGNMHVLFSNNPALVAFARQTEEELALVIINTSPHLEKGSVYLVPEIRMDSAVDLHLLDLFYDLKKPEIQRQLSVQPVYLYRASRILNDGLYVELQPHDAHIFLAEKSKSEHFALRLFNVAKKKEALLVKGT